MGAYRMSTAKGRVLLKDRGPSQKGKVGQELEPVLA